MTIYDKLFTWQKKLVDKYLDRNNFGIFLEQGLGKTPLSLAFVERNQCSRIIIITPNSKVHETKDNEGSWLYWLSQSDNYNLHNVYIKHLTKKMPPLSTFTSFSYPFVMIINYESLFSRDKTRKENVVLKDDVQAFIKSCKGQNVAIIVDESHKMKNLTSMQTKALLRIKQDISIYANDVYTYLLTGTPFTQGYEDLYAQLKMLGCTLTKGSFIDTYCVRGNIPGLLGWQQPIVGYKNIDALYDLIHQYAITIKSKDVLDLPEQVFTQHKLPMIKEFELFTNMKEKGHKIAQELSKRHLENHELVNMKIYDTDSKVNNPFFRCIDYPSQTWLADSTGAFWLRARELSIGFQGNAESYKWFDVSRFAELINFIQNNPQNYVVFYNFTPERIELVKIFNKLGYNIDIYCGDIKDLTYYIKYSKLSPGRKLANMKNVIIANYASGAVGMNWQEYNHCILFSLPLYKDYEQSLKRLHRIGQDKTVFYDIFYQDNWLDKSMLESLNKKIDYNEKMFESDLTKMQEVLKS